MKCNIEDLICDLKEQLGDVDFDELLGGVLNNNCNSIQVNSDFADDEDLDMFDNDDNGVLVNRGTGCCPNRRNNSCCRQRKCCRPKKCCCCKEEEDENRESETSPALTMGCVQNVCAEVAKRIGNVKVTSKFGCACGENISGATVILQRENCCGDFEDVATATTDANGVATFGCVETGNYRIVQVIDGRFFNPPCYMPCDTFTISPNNRFINIDVVNTLNPIAERMLRERKEARRIMRLIEQEQGRNNRRRENRCRCNNCCGCNNGGNCWWIIVLLFLVFGCGGCGFGFF